MAKEDTSNLLEKVSRRKTGIITDIDGKERKIECGRFVIQVASEYSKNQKVFILQEVTIPSLKRHLLRFGYYIIGKKPKMRGKWVWGQYCPFITGKDLRMLIKKAEKEGIL